MILSNQYVIRHKYRNQLLATPPSKEIRVLMIGNNPREMGCLSIHLRNFMWKRFMINATFDLEEGWRIAQYFKPDYVLIDGSFDPELIRGFVDNLRSHKTIGNAVVALLKEDNHTELIIPGVQDYLLKDNIESDTFAFDILSAIAHKIQEDQKEVYKAVNQSNSWISQLFGRKELVSN